MEGILKKYAIIILSIFVVACSALINNMTLSDVTKQSGQYLQQQKAPEVIQLLENNLPEDLSKTDGTVESRGLYAIGYNNLGVAYLATGQAAKAIVALNKGKEALPLWADNYYLLGQAYFYTTDFQQSIKSFEKAISLDSTKVTAKDMSLLLMSYAKSNNTKKALKTYNIIQNKFAKDKDIKFSESDINKAADLMLNQYNGKDNPPEFYFIFGNEYFKKGQYQLALKEYDKAINRDPNYAEAFSNRGLVYAELNQCQRAIEDYNKAISIKKDLAEVYYNRGRCYSRLQQYNQSIDDCNKAKQLRPNYAHAFSCLGITYIGQNKIEIGCNNLQKACELGDCELHNKAKFCDQYRKSSKD